MPKRRRSRRESERGRYRTTRRRSASDARDFDELWLDRFREFSRARYVDLTDVQDRRRWHPDSRWPQLSKNLMGLYPRVLVVPEKHRLARYATYGAKVPLSHVYHRSGLHRRRLIREWEEQQFHDRHGGKYRAQVYSTRISPRVGFHLPWQVIVCIRRKRRREVLHAKQIAGGRGAARAVKHRNAETEVVC